MKFLKNVKNENMQTNLNVSDDDLNFLAVMSDSCLPCVRAGLFSRKTFSYYISEDDDNIDIANSIFTKYGLVTEICFYKKYMMCLRIYHNDKAQTKTIIDFMQSIRQRKHELTLEFYNNRSKARWWNIQLNIQMMKMKQNSYNK